MNYWRVLKEEEKEVERMDIYTDIIERSLKSRFVLNGFDKYIAEKIKTFMLRLGIWAYFYRKDLQSYVVAKCSFVGGFKYADGTLSTLVATCPDGKTFTFRDWRNNKNVVVGYANSNHSAEFSIYKFGSQLADVDLSEEILVKKARAHDFIVAENEGQKKAIERGMQDVEQGKPITIVGQPMGTKSATAIGLGQVEQSRWLNDLSIYKNAVNRELYFYMGCEIGNTIKKAEQSATEVMSNQSASRILLLDSFEHLKEFCKEVTEKFHSASVELSESFDGKILIEGVADNGRKEF